MKARAQASAPPLTDQIASSELYVARKKKRLEEAEQGYSGSCTQEGRHQGRGRCRGGEVGQVEGRSGNVPIFNSSRCVDAKHQPSGRDPEVACCRGRVDTGAGTSSKQKQKSLQERSS